LEQKKKKLSEEIEKLRVKELDRRTTVDLLDKKAKDLGEEFQLFAGSISELKKYGLEIEDVESFAKTVKIAHDLGYDDHLIGSKLRYWNELKEQQMKLLESINKLQRRKEWQENRTGYYEAR
jgi:hypothetical protein